MSSLLKPQPKKKTWEKPKVEEKVAEAKAAEAKAAEAAAAEDLLIFLNKLETNVVPSLQSELQTIFTNQELQKSFTDIEFIYKKDKETDEAFISRVNKIETTKSYLINPGVKSDTSIKRKLAILGYKETDYKNLYDLVRFTVIFPSKNFYKNMYDFIIKINTFHKLDYLKDYMDHKHLKLSITENFYWGVNARFEISSEIKLFEIQFHTHETFKYKNENHNDYKDLQNAKVEKKTLLKVSKNPPKILPENPICFLKMNEFYNSRDYQFNVKKLNVTLKLKEIKPEIIITRIKYIESECLSICQLVGGFNFKNSEHIKVSNIYKRLSKLLGTNNLIAGSEMKLVGEDNQFIETQPPLDKCKIVNSTFGTGFLEKISSENYEIVTGIENTNKYEGYYEPTKNTLYNYKGIFILNVHFNGGGPKEAYKKTSTSHIGEKSFKYDTTHNKVTKGEDITLGTPDDFLFKSIYEESEKIEFGKEFGKEFGNELNEITNFLIYELFPYIDKEINIICGDTNITMSKLRSKDISRDKIGKIIAIALGKIFGGKWLVMMSPIKVQKKREGFFIRNHQINKSTKVRTETAEEDGSIIAFKKNEYNSELFSFENHKTFVFYGSGSNSKTTTSQTETIEALEFKFGVDNALNDNGKKPQDKVFIDHPILYYPLDVILNYYGKTTTPATTTPAESFLIVVNMGSIINAGEKDWHTDDIYYKEDDDGYYIKDTNETSKNSVDFSRVDKIKKFDELVYKYFKSIINKPTIDKSIYKSLQVLPEQVLPEYNMINGFSDIFIVINKEGFDNFNTDFKKTLKEYMLISMMTLNNIETNLTKTDILKKFGISHDDIKGAILKKTQPVALKGGSKLRIKLKKTKRKKGKKTKKKKVRCKKSKKKSR